MNPIPDSQWIGSSTLHKCQLNLCNVVIIALFSHPHFSISLKERKRAFIFFIFYRLKSKALVMAMMEITEAYGVMADGNNIVVGDNNNNNNSMMNPPTPTPTPTKRSRSQRRRRSSLNFTSLDFLSHVPPPPPPLPAARVLEPTGFRFLFDKQLQNSDVSSLRRIVVPKKAAERYLPALEIKEGFPITMDDMDGIHVWSFRYRYWPNNSSRMYVLENTGDFVQTHELRQGDYFALHYNDQKQIYGIEARKAGSGAVFRGYEAEDVILTDYAQAADDGNGALIMNEPEMDMSSFYFPAMDNEMGMSFIYDTSFWNEPAFDFVGGPMTYYSTNVYPMPSFGSIEDSFSVDDFY
ncbi:LOW QUALITY PROTEIN: B3 domain-containing transcription factor FUS3 [Solanum stenotomum]|uniref:LOW QUALITY PROTEIN: B3 domain-containing transcription factor FUS3 n=1 Tax=Solanum stenotomum TaxID=172797 RepID=UPI0020D0395D|nr:LOW QUALITY PROTEIN: B3 domain-containing transcription factor FUS3 [Solanum stenotomum]